MSFISSLAERFTRIKIVNKLPFIQLLGYEKSWGYPQPTDFRRQVEQYKSWAYACINKNAFSVAKCELKIYKTIMRDGIKDLEEITEHPFNDLIKNVNPFFNKFELMSLLVIFLDLTGNAYWWIIKDQLGVPRAIWNIPSHWMRIVPSQDKFISGYVMSVPNNPVPVPFDESDIIHFKYPSPFSLFYGMSPTLAAYYGIDLNNESKTWGINYFKNNAQPAGILTTDNLINEIQHKRLTEMWNSRYQGSENAGKMAILHSGLKYQQMGNSLKEMKFEETARGIRDEILAMYGVPASKLGLVEDVNRANAEANDYTFAKETILPRLMLIEEKLNEKLAPLYDEKLIIKFENPVPEDRQYRLQEIQTHLSTGYSTIDEERIKDGLKPLNLPETSKPLIPFGQAPAGSENETEELPDKSKPKEEEDKDEDKDEDKKGIKVISKGALKRKRVWNRFDTVSAPQEKHFQEIMRGYFKEQFSVIKHNLSKIKSFTKADVSSTMEITLLFDVNEQTEKLKKISKPSILEAVRSGTKLTAQDLDIDFGIFEARAQRTAEQRINDYAWKVNDTSVNLLKNEIKLAIENGETVVELAERIDKIEGFSEVHRARFTAQTEIIGALNNGQLEALRDAQIEFKEWITARDEHVRDSHQVLDGIVVKLEDKFESGIGGQMMFPGDRHSGAEAADLVNCRCTMSGVINK